LFFKWNNKNTLKNKPREEDIDFRRKNQVLKKMYINTLIEKIGKPY
jgi:hypothetical protein